jgi:hypothetical protein
LDVSGISFSVKSNVIIIPGWRAVLNVPDEEKGEDDAPELPVLSGGDVLPINGTDLLEKQTKPRPLHTESSLFSAMETCGKDLSDEAEREALKNRVSEHLPHVQALSKHYSHVIILSGRKNHLCQQTKDLLCIWLSVIKRLRTWLWQASGKTP